MGKEGQTVPEMNDDKVNEISNRYIELYEKITGKIFSRSKLDEEKLFGIIAASLKKYEVV